jgi:hypothetical protein
VFPVGQKLRKEVEAEREHEDLRIDGRKGNDRKAGSSPKGGKDG